MSLPFPNHPFLTGSFAPILLEVDAYDLPVRGEVPKDLRGTLYRNSPNPQFAPRDDNYLLVYRRRHGPRLSHR